MYELDLAELVVVEVEEVEGADPPPSKPNSCGFSADRLAVAVLRAWDRSLETLLLVADAALAGSWLWLSVATGAGVTAAVDGALNDAVDGASDTCFTCAAGGLWLWCETGRVGTMPGPTIPVATQVAVAAAPAVHTATIF